MTPLQALAEQSPAALALGVLGLLAAMRMAFGASLVAWGAAFLIAAIALALSAPWGWMADLAAGLILGAAALAWPGSPARRWAHGPRATTPPTLGARPPAVLLGRTGRTTESLDGLEVWLDGRTWPARVEGGRAKPDVRVRVIGIGTDGRLVVGPLTEVRGA